MLVIVGDLTIQGTISSIAMQQNLYLVRDSCYSYLMLGKDLIFLLSCTDLPLLGGKLCLFVGKLPLDVLENSNCARI